MGREGLERSTRGHLSAVGDARCSGEAVKCCKRDAMQQTAHKALTGVDDHSRYCVSARLMARERTQSVCDGFSSALKTYGVPAQVLTDNGKVFTGRFALG